MKNIRISKSLSLVIACFFALQFTASAQWSQSTTAIYTSSFSKNVGIGTSTPTNAKLQFANQAGNKITLYDNGNNSAYGFGINNSNLCAYVPTGAMFSVRTNAWNGAEKFVVTSEGNVGIGTSAPLNANLQFGNVLGNKITLFDNGNNEAYGFGINDYNLSAYVPTGSRFSVRANSSTGAEKFVVTSDGNVGVGISNPSAKLQINQGNLHVDSGYGIEFGDQYATNPPHSKIWENSATGHLILRPGGYDGFPEGPVPGYLELQGKVYVNTPNSASSSLCLGTPLSGEGIESKRTPGGNQFGLDFITAYQNRLSIAQNGNVGIGTINSPYKLSVNGTIRAKEIRVETGWADYVFAPGYQLRPLEEVEQHIKANQHLPGIPSACEIEENGLDVGAVQAKMMEKIEELTLYLIEIKKDNTLLRQEVENLKQK